MKERGSIKLSHITLINYLESMGSLNEFLFHKIQRKQGIKSMQIYSWKRIVGVYPQVCSGISLAVRFVGRDRRLWNSMVQGTQRFRQVQASLRNSLCPVWFVLP